MGETTCWADPLTRAERRVLREKLARACNANWCARQTGFEPASNGRWRIADHRKVAQHITMSNELADLHLDVTERAEVATR
jgi:hypothetical protein